MTAPNILYVHSHDTGRWVQPYVLERLGPSVPDEGILSPPLRRQSDAVNDDWVRRDSEIRLGTEFDLVPAATV